jgi:hypothetical protein
MAYTSQAEPAAPPRRKRRIFPWFFLAIQVIFLIWLITGLAQGTGLSHAQIVSLCGHGAWQGVFKSYHDDLNTIQHPNCTHALLPPVGKACSGELPFRVTCPAGAALLAIVKCFGPLSPGGAGRARDTRRQERAKLRLSGGGECASQVTGGSRLGPV